MASSEKGTVMTKNNNLQVWFCIVLPAITVLSVWSGQALSTEQNNSGTSKTKKAIASATIEEPLAITIHIQGVKFEFVRIPAGRFKMGSEAGDSDERPIHQVRINESFYMGKTEVTVRQFRAFTKATGYRTEAEKGRWAANYAWGFPIVPARDLDWRKPKFPQSEDNPAVCISWNDAVAFCRWLSKETGLNHRLPSEAEWEYACRAGRDGDFKENIDKIGWYRDNSGYKTRPAAQKKPNAWGLYDMHGNAWEWCQDVWHSNYKGAPTDGSPWLTEDYLPAVAIRRVLRGGAWCRLGVESTCTYRYRGTPDFRSNGSGFRIVHSPAKTSNIDKEPKNNKHSSENPKGRGVPPKTNQIGTDSKLTVNVDGINFEFVRIPAGKFMMGSEADNEEKPIHQVSIGYNFYIGKTEATVRQFSAFIEDTDYQTDAEKERWAWTRTGLRDWDPEALICWWNLPFTQSEDHPATCISWYDAMEFCKWLSAETGMQIRLPSESEWEYACRAGTTSDFAGDINQMAWYRYNSGHRTHPVAQKKPNAWNLYDTHGNVWEWCLDMWHKNYEGAPADGSAWTEAKTFEPVMRGGSFVNPPWWLRSANHMRNNPGNRFSYNQGIRLVLSSE